MHSYADASSFQYCVGSGYFASRGKNSPSGYFAASAKIALSLMLTLTQTEEKHYFASRGKIATSIV